MQTRGDNIYVNIKELPQLDQVQPGDLLIVETDTGTNVIDFSNFILPPENTTFYGELENITSELIGLSGDITTATLGFLLTASELTTSLTNTISNVTTQIQNFSATYFDNLVTGAITFNGTSTETSAGVNCTAVRNSHGNYTIVFTGNVNAVNVSSNADKTRLDAVGQNTCVFTTMSAASASNGGVVYENADATVISVIGA